MHSFCFRGSDTGQLEHCNTIPSVYHQFLEVRSPSVDGLVDAGTFTSRTLRVRTCGVNDCAWDTPSGEQSSLPLMETSMLCRCFCTTGQPSLNPLCTVLSCSVESFSIVLGRDVGMTTTVVFGNGRPCGALSAVFSWAYVAHRLFCGNQTRHNGKLYSTGSTDE